MFAYCHDEKQLDLKIKTYIILIKSAKREAMNKKQQVIE